MLELLLGRPLLELLAELLLEPPAPLEAEELELGLVPELAEEDELELDDAPELEIPELDEPPELDAPEPDEALELEEAVLPPPQAAVDRIRASKTKRTFSICLEYIISPKCQPRTLLNNQ